VILTLAPHNSYYGSSKGPCQRFSNLDKGVVRDPLPYSDGLMMVMSERSEVSHVRRRAGLVAALRREDSRSAFSPSEPPSAKPKMRPRFADEYRWHKHKRSPLEHCQRPVRRERQNTTVVAIHTMMVEVDQRTRNFPAAPRRRGKSGGAETAFLR